MAKLILSFFILFCLILCHVSAGAYDRNEGKENVVSDKQPQVRQLEAGPKIDPNQAPGDSEDDDDDDEDAGENSEDKVEEKLPENKVEIKPDEQPEDKLEVRDYRN